MGHVENWESQWPSQCYVAHETLFPAVWVVLVFHCSCYLCCGVCVCSVGSSLCYTPQTSRGSSLPDSAVGTPVVRGVVGTPRGRGVSAEASPKVGGPSSSGGSMSTRTTKRTRSDDVTLMKSGADTRSSKRSKSESLSGSRKVWYCRWKKELYGGTKPNCLPECLLCVCLCVCVCVYLCVWGLHVTALLTPLPYSEFDFC